MQRAENLLVRKENWDLYSLRETFTPDTCYFAYLFRAIWTSGLRKEDCPCQRRMLNKERDLQRVFSFKVSTYDRIIKYRRASSRFVESWYLNNAFLSSTKERFDRYQVCTVRRESSFNRVSLITREKKRRRSELRRGLKRRYRQRKISRDEQ